jgi:hypothetical protein
MAKRVEYDCERALDRHTGEERLFDLAGMEFDILLRERTAPLDEPTRHHVASVDEHREDFDDLLDRAPRVTTLLINSMTRFALRRPHPNIELIISHEKLSAETLRCLPSLRGIELRGEMAALEGLPPTLERLKMFELDLRRLAALPRLQHLHTSGRGQNVKHLPALRDLRTLEFAHGTPRGLSDLSVLSGCGRLESLTAGVASLAGIDRLPRLRRLTLGGRNVPSFAPLRGTKLEELSVSFSRLPPEVDVVGELTTLRKLTLSCGGVWTTTFLPSARLFSRLKKLQSLDCFHTQLQDPDLSPLAALRDLTYLNFHGLYTAASWELLRKRLPKCRLDHVYVGVRETERPKTKLGPVHASLEDGSWEILEDLTGRLKLETNHDVQDAVEAELRRAAPAALKRIELDSDTEIFCARAKSRADIERVADAVAALLKKTSTKKRRPGR